MTHNYPVPKPSPAFDLPAYPHLLGTPITPLSADSPCHCLSWLIPVDPLPKSAAAVCDTCVLHDREDNKKNVQDRPVSSGSVIDFWDLVRLKFSIEDTPFPPAAILSPARVESRTCNIRSESGTKKEHDPEQALSGVSGTSLLPSTAPCRLVYVRVCSVPVGKGYCYIIWFLVSRSPFGPVSYDQACRRTHLFSASLSFAPLLILPKLLARQRLETSSAGAICRRPSFLQLLAQITLLFHCLFYFSFFYLFPLLLSSFLFLQTGSLPFPTARDLPVVGFVLFGFQ